MPSSQSGRFSWASHDDDVLFYIAVIGVFGAVFSYLLWDRAHADISDVIMALHRWEIGFIRPFTHRFDQVDEIMAATNPVDVTLRSLYGVAHDVGAFLRIPAVVLMVCLGGLCMVRATPNRYRRQFDLDALIREQALSFPITAAFARRHLRLVNPGEVLRPADYALTPQEWVARYALTRSGTFSDEQAEKALALQLGPRWEGFEKAAPHVRCLAAAFTLHFEERRSDAVALLGAASLAFADPGADHEGGPATSLAFPADDQLTQMVDSVLLDYATARGASGVARAHAFTNTALMSLLNEARVTAGVLAPAQFAWLKLVDRPLWYALHSLGFDSGVGIGRYVHPNPRVEAIGARAHWAAEQALGSPISSPEIARALEAIRDDVERRAAG